MSDPSWVDRVAGVALGGAVGDALRPDQSAGAHDGRGGVGRRPSKGELSADPGCEARRR